MSARTRRGAANTAFYATAVPLAILFLAPLVWSGFTSVYGSRATGGEPGFGVDNYLRLVEYGAGLETYVVNSVIVAVVAVVGTLVVSVLGGYAFSRFSFPGKNLLFLGALAILMVPHPTILIPIYQMLRTFGLQNSLIGVGLVVVMFQLPFGLFMMRNAFDGLPRELEEAALIDGLSRFGALRRVLLRGVTPAMVTVGMFAFIASWNEFLTPLLFLTNGDSFTLPVALVSLRSGEFGAIDLGALQAGIVVAAVPCLLIFILLQRHYVRGFTAGAVRG
ncbi:carbohydrate ABC transporter permease [Agromyces atrinae]|jgi:multiple sugar transport system permease protein|uniref:Carbohydrate ABC transporter permease n=1 Tax=Agromyces atrinae TaxID=592376 RepID=A0A4Q2MA94_9MICO|nr:carbohydrate ABC transporter permease [Agromyces atrinae]MCI2957383.1 carbohydrate ABC transporter permease [Agromyces atrinae]NYD67287.1 multiple sugar transport system permease protein [Agromyces atrinae]RXZ86882.1 carbohydrate ABC transporter permease [Agromyces atrinae]